MYFYAGWRCLIRLKLCHLRIVYVYAQSGELGAVKLGELKAVGVEGQRVRPRGQQLADPDGKRRIHAADECNLLPGDFVAMAVRAVKDPGAPQIAEAGDCRELVCETGSNEDMAGFEKCAIGESYLLRGLLGRPGEAFHRGVGNMSTKFLQFRVAPLE